MEREHFTAEVEAVRLDRTVVLLPSYDLPVRVITVDSQAKPSDIIPVLLEEHKTQVVLVDRTKRRNEPGVAELADREARDGQNVSRVVTGAVVAGLVATTSPKTK